VTIQINMLAVALCQFAEPRYMYPIWPLLWLVLVLFAWKLWPTLRGLTSEELSSDPELVMHFRS
jgi:hypothetical protein